MGAQICLEILNVALIGDLLASRSRCAELVAVRPSGRMAFEHAWRSFLSLRRWACRPAASGCRLDLSGLLVRMCTHRVDVLSVLLCGRRGARRVNTLGRLFLFLRRWALRRLMSSSHLELSRLLVCLRMHWVDVLCEHASHS